MSPHAPQDDFVARPAAQYLRRSAREPIGARDVECRSAQRGDPAAPGKPQRSTKVPQSQPGKDLEGARAHQRDPNGRLRSAEHKWPDDDEHAKTSQCVEPHDVDARDRRHWCPNQLGHSGRQAASGQRRWDDSRHQSGLRCKVN